MKPSGSFVLVPADSAVPPVPAVSCSGFEESEEVAVEESEEVEVVVLPKT